MYGRLDTLSVADVTQYEGQTFHTGMFARCELAAIETNGDTYTAVGEMDARWLAEWLHNLLDEPA